MISFKAYPDAPVVEIVVEGAVTNDELTAAIGGMRAAFDGDGKRRVIEIIRHFTGIELSALWTDIKMGVPLARQIERIAVVADQVWIRQFAELGHLFTNAELKVFPPEELAEARAWIAAT
jgi:hypothetical protein